MKKPRWLPQASALLLACACGSPALAAGGHHAVDDAAILEPGQCEVEGWFSRVRGGERLLHAGTGCRVGPVELGVAAEYARLDGSSQTGYGAQVKWATEVAEGVSVGFALSPSWATHVRPRYQGLTAAGLATWTPREDFALHLNLGRDLVHRGEDLDRSGVAVEWFPASGWSLLAERYLEEESHFVRAGVRWAFSPNWSLDLSRAHRLRGPGASNWTLGLTWLLGGK